MGGCAGRREIKTNYGNLAHAEKAQLEVCRARFRIDDPRLVNSWNKVKGLRLAERRDGGGVRRPDPRRRISLDRVEMSDGSQNTISEHHLRLMQTTEDSTLTFSQRPFLSPSHKGHSPPGPKLSCQSHLLQSNSIVTPRLLLMFAKLPK